MLKKILILFFFCAFSREGVAYTLNKILDHYTRPITILYISEHPKWIEARENDVVIYWTENKDFLIKIISSKPKNCIVLTGSKSVQKHEYLSEAEHFDVAIIECKESQEESLKEYHYADHTLLNNQYYYSPKKTIDKYRRVFKRNAHRGTLSIKATDKRKDLLKKGVQIPFLGGLSYHRFLMLKGKYPTEKCITDQMYELYDHLLSNDFRLDNMILQGTALKIVDYNPKIKAVQKASQDDVIRQLLDRRKTLKFYAIIR